MDEFFAKNRLSAWLDGELSAAEAREVEDALARSADLRAELEGLRAGIKLLREGGPVPAPKGFAARLEERIEREPMPVGWRRYLRGARMEVLMLAAAALLVLTFAAKKQADEPTASPPVATASDAKAPEAVAAKETEAPEDEAPDAADEEPEVDAAAVPVPGKADGVLRDDRLGRKATPKVTSSRSGTKSGVEREPYEAAWEKGEPEAPPVVQSAAPFQFRLRPTSDTGLRDLAALAASLGGTLADQRGKPLAPYPMDAGETRTVKLMLPAVNSGSVAKRLAELGAIEVVSVTDRTLYAPGATVPVVVEVTQP